MTTWTVGILAWLLGPAVGGEHRCPSPAEVERALGAIDPGGGPDGRVGTAGVAGAGSAAAGGGETIAVEAGDGDEEVVVVRFRGPGGGLLAERALPVRLSCEERAQVAAVIIAARYGRFPASSLVPPPLPAIPDAAVVAGAPVASGGVRAGAATEGPPFELELAAVGAWAGVASAPGVRAAVAFEPRPERALRLSVGYVFEQTTAFGTGQASWSRAVAALGYGRRFAWDQSGRMSLEVGLDLLGSLLRLEGRGFRQNERHLVLHPGLAATSRFGYQLPGRLGVWVGASLNGWPRPQTLYLRDGGSTSRLPALELLGSAGLSWRAGRR